MMLTLMIPLKNLPTMKLKRKSNKKKRESLEPNAWSVMTVVKSSLQSPLHSFMLPRVAMRTFLNPQRPSQC